MSRRILSIHLLFLVLATGGLVWRSLASRPAGASISMQDRRAVVTFETEPGSLCRIDVSTDLQNWHPVRTVTASGTSIEYSHETGAIGQAYVRAVSLEPGSALTGDYLATSAGDVLIHPVDHASLILQWDGKTIYNDPVGGGAAFAGIPPADLIMVGHRHGDHYSASTIEAVRTDDTRIIAPQDLFDRMPSALQALTTVLANGESTQVIGLDVQAVPAYNQNHPQGRDNGYVVTVGGKRIYFSGDTGATAEMRALEEIDVAFVSMNVPFTMNITDAASATRDFGPKVIYPYHYRNQDGSFADLESFREMVGDDVGVEVRVREWY